MRARLSLVLFAVPLFAATTPIVGTFTLADGTPATGTITISWPRFTTAGSAVVPANTLAVSVASGSLSVFLEPVDTSTANGVLGQWYYTVRYSWRGNKSYAWRVPTSASPVNVTSIETDLPSNSSGVLPSVALTQLPPGGASIGNCLIWSGSYWGPAACTNTADPTTTKGDLIVRGNSGPDRFAAPANGVYCWTWTNGVPTYTPCGGGGGGGPVRLAVLLMAAGIALAADAPKRNSAPDEHLIFQQPSAEYLRLAGCMNTPLPGVM